jgi:phenylpropionate dioxygenase-like ring-hydroxylating dioxygenase large terminal subunit
VSFIGKDLVLYRSQDGIVRALDAYCPHMGAHLCDGTVEGDSIRCPFHHWKFSSSGACTDIPVKSDPSLVPPLQAYKVGEKYGLIWLWTGAAQDAEPIPVIPELLGQDLDFTLGTPFFKNCHPNVVMVNAIDAHHFTAVHQLVVNLDMEANQLSPRCIQFSNKTPLPTSNPLLRFAKRFYSKALTYEMTYWWGNTGSVMVGPDFLHFYIFFSLRPTLDGKTEGQTILVTRRRPGILGFFLNPIILFLTKCVGNYFAKGDTIIFSRINFEFKTPVKADRAIIQFIEHYETQMPSTFLKALS